MGGVRDSIILLYGRTPSPLGCALLASCHLLSAQAQAGSQSCGCYALSTGLVPAGTGSSLVAGTGLKNEKNLSLVKLWSLQAGKAGRILEAK